MSREMKKSGIDWIGNIPLNWKVLRVKNLFSANKDIVGTEADNYERLALTLSGVIKRSKTDNEGLQPEAFTGYQILSKGELVFKLIDLENVSTSRVGLSPYTGIVSPAYIVLSPNDRVHPKYAEHYFLSMWKREIFNHLGDDGVRSSLNTKNLINIPFCTPPFAEQRKIANFLDCKCTEIDAVREHTRSTIDEYKKLKQSVITEAVTKGFRGKRPMKDSGVEWIGSIPEDWQIFRVANLYREASDKGNDELPILTVSINSGVSDRELSNEESERVFVRSEDRSKYKRVQPGDLVYNMMRAWQGAFGAVRVDGMVSPAYVVARPMQQLDSRYVEYLFRTPEAIEEMHRYSYGVADFRLRLYWSQFRNIRMCVPPYEEQVEIADYIDEKVQEILALIKKKQQYLVELENYKKSLIYEYVTGKKEVPNG